MSRKYSKKQHVFAQLCTKQMSKMWYKNIRAFLRCRDSRVGVFLGSPCICRQTWCTAR